MADQPKPASPWIPLLGPLHWLLPPLPAPCPLPPQGLRGVHPPALVGSRELFRPGPQGTAAAAP